MNNLFAPAAPDSPEMELGRRMCAMLNANPVPEHVLLNVLLGMYRSVVLQRPDQRQAAIEGCSALVGELLSLAANPATTDLAAAVPASTTTH